MAPQQDSSATVSDQSRLTLEAIAVLPAPGLAIPNTFAFDQAGTRLTYLLGTPDDPTQKLYALDLATGATSLAAEPPHGGTREDTLSPEEELRRQRERSLAVGLTTYSRAEHSDRLLVPVGGSIFVLDALGQPLRQILDAAERGPAITPTFAPNGEWIAFVRDGEVWVVPTAGGPARQVTTGARGTGKTNGLAEYVAQEELDRHVGYWWSPDSRWLAYEEADETVIPPYLIVHQGNATLGPDAYEEHRYPFAGAANARVRLAVVSIEGGAPVWLDLGPDDDLYLARVFWWRDGQPGAVLLNRAQTSVSLVRFNPQTGQRTAIVVEQTPTWINLPKAPLFQTADGEFIWASERSGFRHLYLYDRGGALLHPVTSGEWMVDEIVAVDDAARRVYFTGTRDDPREKHLYMVALEGGDPRRLTRESGTHDVWLDSACRHYVDLRSALDTPPQVTVRSLAGDDEPRVVPLPPDARLARGELAPPRLIEMRNREGTLLYGALYLPDPARFGRGPYPTIVHVYGGPHAQEVTNSWGRMTAALNRQYLRSLGFLVFSLDNRGSARRGLAFESPVRHHLGSVEVDDQVDGVRWLVEQGLADPTRVGIFGWSYGGYMTLMCLARAPEVFKVGVAGAPVTAWDGYDSAYTERYMGTPQSNSAGYAQSSVLAHAPRIEGKLLLIHGLLDENVHFRHTARLINTLIRARKSFETLLFPDERHMPRHLPDRVYQNERIVDFFVRYL